MFVTLAYVVLNAKTGIISYVNAGHGPMLRIRHSNNKVDIIGQANEIPLAIREKSIYRQENFQLEHGDYLVLFTDGITEARNYQGEEMSLEILWTSTLLLIFQNTNLYMESMINTLFS